MEIRNYSKLKLTDQPLKIIQMLINNLIRHQVHNNEMRLTSMPGHETKDATFISRQLHKKNVSKKKDFYFAFRDLEKAFDQVLRDVLWWVLRKLGVKERVSRFLNSM